MDNTNNLTTYMVVTRKNKDGYWVMRTDRKMIVYHPENENLREERKYTSKRPMTLKNAESQIRFLHYILPKKLLKNEINNI